MRNPAVCLGLEVGWLLDPADGGGNQYDLSGPSISVLEYGTKRTRSRAGAALGRTSSPRGVRPENRKYMKRRVRVALIYGSSLVASIGAFLLIRNLGRSLVAAGTSESRRSVPTGPAAGGSVLIHVLLALAVVIVLARVLSLTFRRFKQPQVMGEVIAGILLGPSFFGWAAPWAASQVLAVSVVPYVTVISQIGIILYMFLVGVEPDTSLLRQRTQASIAISHASIVAPFLMGGALALWLYPRYAARGVSFTAFALFLGVAMSVTAFPVLARILTDRGMQTSRTGVL